MADVFVSYKREEHYVANTIVAALEAAGYSVWWDNELTPRMSWDTEIEQELSAARAVLVLWSSKSVQEGSFVRKEAAYAQDHNKLVPAWIEHCALPLRFRDIQTADLTDFNANLDIQPEWARVLRWIEALINPSSSNTIRPETHSRFQEETVGIKRRTSQALDNSKPAKQGGEDLYSWTVIAVGMLLGASISHGEWSGQPFPASLIMGIGGSLIIGAAPAFAVAKIIESLGGPKFRIK